MTAQHDLGAVSGLDGFQQQSPLDTTRVQAQLLLNQRAVRTRGRGARRGARAAVLDRAEGHRRHQRPADPARAAERRAAAAARHRVGPSGQWPRPMRRSAWRRRRSSRASRSRSAISGGRARSSASLLSAPSLLWMLGTAVSQVVFDGGRRAANVDFANEGYKAAQANYRRTVLNAFQQVQDGIVGLVGAGRRREAIAPAVVDAQRLAFACERPLFGRPRRLSRRDHRAAVAAHRASGRTCRSAASSGRRRSRWSKRWAAAGTRRSRPRANRMANRRAAG